MDVIVRERSSITSAPLEEVGVGPKLLMMLLLLGRRGADAIIVQDLIKYIYLEYIAQIFLF